MNVLSFELNGNRLRWISGYAPTAGEIAGSKCRFEFDSDWLSDTAIVSAVFWSDPADPKYAPLTLSDGVGWCNIPAITLNDAGELNISLVVGSYDSGALTQFADGVDESTGVSATSSTIVALRVEESAVSAIVVEQPSLSLYAAMLRKVGEISEIAEDAKENVDSKASANHSHSLDAYAQYDRASVYLADRSSDDATIIVEAEDVGDGANVVTIKDRREVYGEGAVKGFIIGVNVDTELNEESANPVENKVVAAAFSERDKNKLALGETASSAYRGDRGKIAYDHSQESHAPAGAEPNQNAFSRVEITNSGSSDSYSAAAVAENEEDTLRLHVYSGINVNWGTRNNIHIYGDVASDTRMGMMTPDDKKKLDATAKSVADIDTALDAILAIQNELIGGADV